MEYASFSFHLMAPSAKRSVNAFHYTALRSIYKKKKEFGNSNLLSLAQGITMDERLGNLKENYFKKAIKHKNPLIMQLIEEYKSFKNGRIFMPSSLFQTLHEPSTFIIFFMNVHCAQAIKQSITIYF
jgi:hypothetical protein